MGRCLRRDELLLTTIRDFCSGGEPRVVRRRWDCSRQRATMAMSTSAKSATFCDFIHLILDGINEWPLERTGTGIHRVFVFCSALLSSLSLLYCASCVLQYSV